MQIIMKEFFSKSNKDFAGVSDWDYFLQISDQDVIQVGIGDVADNNIYLNGDTVITTGQWHHIVATKNATKFAIYIDGELDKTGVSAGVMADARMNDFPLHIGRIGIAGEWHHVFHGMIDEIRLWNRTLDTNDIYNEYISNLDKIRLCRNACSI